MALRLIFSPQSRGEKIITEKRGVGEFTGISFDFVYENKKHELYLMHPIYRYKFITYSHDILRGSPRLAGRRLAVGDIVCSVAHWDNLNEYMTSFNLSIQQVQECLDYCRKQKCIKDNPAIFCYNCTLRIPQDAPFTEGDIELFFNPEEPHYFENWLSAERDYQKYFGSIEESNSINSSNDE